MQPRSRKNGTAGFTLIELMVVVGIIAIVSAMVMPSFTMALQKNRQREAGNFIVQGIFSARSRAARTGRCHRVRIYLRQAEVSGGTGGAVAVDMAPENECSRAIPAGNFRNLMYKSVGSGSSDPVFGGPARAGLVGKDVSIFQSVVRAGKGLAVPVGGVVTIHFEASGGLYMNDLNDYYFEILAHTGSGAQTGVRTYVHITSAGGVSYGI